MKILNQLSHIILQIIFLLLMGSCSFSNNPTDYFGESIPDSIPMIFAPGKISLEGRLEQGISFTPDNRELAFGILSKENLNGVIYYAKKINENWTEPKVFEPLRGRNAYLLYFSPNGNSLLYAESKAGLDNMSTDIWMMEKLNGEWINPRKLNSPINSQSREANASMNLDGTIYFSSNRICRDLANCHTADLFYSDLNNNKYKEVKNIDEFRSANDEESVFISPNDDFIIFCKYTGDQTGVDLYISYQNGKKQWIEPQLIESKVNSKYWERRPFVTIDNKFLFFTRLEIAGNRIVESDIYWVNTSNLFKPFVYNPIADSIITVGEKYSIHINNDYFKDIDEEDLIIKGASNMKSWLNYDTAERKLHGIPKIKGNYEFIITATDRNLNSAVDTIKIIVR
ncbi:putative Ig domain-containing protein [Sphingobacterium lactis]|uniref:putative Ig domain-containing protein n=1 Tax=Sphingobacterium lactis TaxID=797291 RepID=UPI003DA2B24C